MNCSRQELPGQRSENRKVFENTDHSRTIEIYPEPIHEQSGEGAWVELNYEMEEICDPWPGYVCRRKNTETWFRKEAGPEDTGIMDKPAFSGHMPESGDAALGESVSGGNTAREEWRKWIIGVRKGNSVLAWGIEGALAAKAMKETVEGATRREDRVVYREILPETDLACRMKGAGVKEDILLRSPGAPGSFSWVYQLGGLKVKLIEPENTVIFMDGDGTEEFRMAVPFMRDARGVLSRDIAMKLELLEEGAAGLGETKASPGFGGDLAGSIRVPEKGKAARVTIIPDRGWLEDKDRAYPVTIDPVTTTSTARADIGDTYADSRNYGSCYVNHTILQTWGRPNFMRTFIQFQLPQLSPADMVTSARLSLYALPAGGSGDSQSRSVSVHRLRQPFDSVYMDWSNAPVYDETVEDLRSFNTAAEKWVSFDITRLVKDWYAGSTNYGLMLRDYTELGPLSVFLSSDTVDGYTGLHPLIQVNYVNYSGLEDFWSYHSQDAGRAGTVHVNDCCGSLVACHRAAATSGSRMPMDVKLYYNTNDVSVNIGYGLGWRLGYHQSILRWEIAGTVYYRHIEGDGTVHYFYYNTSKSKWLDEMDPKKELAIDTGSAQERYVITDASHGQLVFNMQGLLVKARDRNGNELTVAWNNAGTRVTQVTDGAGRSAVLVYHTDAQGHMASLASMTSPAGTKVFTITDGALTGITDVNGETMSYSYNESGLLSAIQGPDGGAYEYAYNTDSGKVRKITQRGADGSEGQTLSLAYGYNRTTFTDRDGRSETFRFNHAGCLLQVSDGFGHACAAEYIDSGAYRNRLQCVTRLQASVVQLLKDPLMDTAGNAGSVWVGIGSANVAASVNTAPAGLMAGSRSLKLSCQTASGGGYWKQDVQAEKGVTYVFSMYVKADVAVGSGGTGVYLRAAYPGGDGATLQAYSHFVRCTTAEFIRLYCTFKIPETAAATTVSLCFCMNNAAGNAYADMAQLEKGSTPSRCCLVDGGSFPGGSLEGFQAEGGPEDGIAAQGQVVYLPVRRPLVVKTACVMHVDTDTGSGMATSLSAGDCLCSLGEVKAPDNTLWLKVQDPDGHKGYIRETDGLPYAGGSHASMNAVTACNMVKLHSSASDVLSNVILEGIPKGIRMAIRNVVTGTDSKPWFYGGLLAGLDVWHGYIRAEDAVRLAGNAMAGYIGSGPASAWYLPSTDPLSGSWVVRTIPAGTQVSLRGTVETPSGTFYAVLSGQEMTFLREEDVTITTAAAVSPFHALATPAQPGGFPPYLYHFTGDPAADKRLKKMIPVGGSEGDVYMVNAWGYGDSLPMPEGTPRRFGVKVSFVAADGTRDDHEVNFSQDLAGWQFLGEAAAARQGYAHIEVAYQYCHQAGSAWVTGLSLYREEYGHSYSYDEDGNLVSSADILKNTAGFEYSAGQDLTGLTDPRGNRKTFVYDSRHNVTNAVSPMNVRTRLTYDTHGNITRSGVYDPSSVYTGTWVSRSFTADGNHVAQVTDAAGNSISYSWDTQKDHLLSMQDPAGNTAAYTYDPLGRMTGASMAAGSTQAASVAYGYGNDGRLSQVTHNGFHYQFTWDTFGRARRCDIGGSQVLSYGYEPYNGNLLRKNYANGDTIRFSYDTQDRVTGISLVRDGNVTQLFSYAYDREGYMAKVTDCVTGKSWKQFYDMTGRLCQSQCSDGGHYIYIYDANGNILSMSSVEDGVQVRMRYTYDKDNRETRAETGGLYRVTAYDAFDRPTSRRLRDSSGSDRFATVYAYDDTDPANRCGLVRSVRNGSRITYYEYDSRCNITKITFPDGGTARYTYDALSQLVREDSEVQGKTFVYDYDLGGNMTKLREYSYTTGSLPASPSREVLGTYSSGGWKDQLVQWDGKTITYDASGNMVTFGTGTTYTWTRGRLLESVINGTSTVASYHYNDRGLRLRKTVGDAVTSYSWAGNLLTAQKTGAQTMHFFYDSDAQLLGLQLGGINYYYVKNAVNDIIGLVDGSGNLVVDYVYDSWGKLLSMSDTTAEGIGSRNPFRYKEYYYDSETNFYYIGSRYYDPDIHRFIGPDEVNNLGINQDFASNNLYEYCGNNPIGRTDDKGEWWYIAAPFAGALIGVVTQFVCNVGLNLADGKTLGESLVDALPNEKNWIEYGSAALTGALTATNISCEASVCLGASLGALTYMTECDIYGTDANPLDFTLAVAGGAAAGWKGGAGINAKKLEGVINTSLDKLKTAISPKKIAMYTSKIVSSELSIAKGIDSILKSGAVGNIVAYYRKKFTGSVV